MNPRTVFHLLSADIRRLRWLILTTLLLLGVQLIPWLTKGPWGAACPEWLLFWNQSFPR